MLSPYRVLDLTDNRAALGPMILAGLGADVIKVEPPGGSLERSTPSDPAGLHFAAFNRNKRSVALNLDEGGGRESFLKLASGSDFLFENDPPDAMAARGLGFDDLREVNPRLVYVSTTPFGQNGAYARHAASDLTLAAMGGMMALTGDADRPPLRISVPQAWLHAATESAVAALVAHRRRLQTGEAQFVDVSVQTAVCWTLLNAMTAHAVQGKDFQRNGTVTALATFDLKTTYRCDDGYVVFAATHGALPVIAAWMVEDGVVPSTWLTDEDWLTYTPRLLAGQPITHSFEEVIERIEAYIRRHTKLQLMQRGLPLGIFFAPVSTVADVLSFEQLEARRYWQPLELSEGRTARAPGPFVRFSRSSITQWHGVPAAGEHSNAVLAGVRESPDPGEPGVGPHPLTGPFPFAGPLLPFTGLKIADFSWVGVGPITAKYLADHGATTVHVESSTRPDVLRQVGPFKDGIFGANRSQYFGAFNTSKQSISLDLKNRAGLDVARRLVAWADVCLESFTPGTMAGLGLGYETARGLNPDIIMVSTCLMGQTGPAAQLAGYGFHAAAVSGFPQITGWPDRAPSGPWAAYTDTIANRFLAASIMAALDHRRRTGEGQYIEQSQLESALHFLAPEILEYQVSGALPNRLGNDSSAAPHGAYQCLGDDQWCAIAVETDDQWRALRSVMGEPEWAMDPALAGVEGRLACRADLDARIGEWARGLERYALMQRLQNAGVPAGVVQRSSDLLRDPQLQHRRFFRPLQHPEMGEVLYEGHQFRIPGYDSGPRFAAPCLGEHSIEVMRDILEMSEDEIADVAASGALS